MPYRLTKIYTRAGDQGFTHLGKRKISKDDALIETIGTVDELNSSIGTVLSQDIKDRNLVNFLNQVQQKLFDFGAELYDPNNLMIHADDVTALEKQIDAWNQKLGPLKEFILPQGTPATAFCHLARTITRRAERRLVHLHRASPLTNPELIRYLNRLSDALFVAARILGKGRKREKMWKLDGHD